MAAEPTLETIAQASGGKLARDGQSVVVSYGSNGYLRLFPSVVWADGTRNEIPAVRIDGKLTSGNGGAKEALRAKLRAAGLEIR